MTRTDGVTQEVDVHAGHERLLLGIRSAPVAPWEGKWGSVVREGSQYVRCTHTLRPLEMLPLELLLLNLPPYHCRYQASHAAAAYGQHRQG